MSRSPADYAAAFQRHMPPGRVWTREPGSQQAQFALAMARSLARVDAAAEAFLANSLPGDNTDLLLNGKRRSA
jgi:uncharacterized protein YmfQ (DUF2313 family)